MIRTSASDLNKRVTLQYQTKVSDNMGGWTYTWNDSVTIWAAIWPVSANETVAANATSMVISHRIRIRYRSVLKASWRIKFGDKFYAIVSIINPNMGNEFLDILVKEAA